MEETTFEGDAGASRAGGFWRSVFDAVRGTHHDYTKGPIGRAILLLAIPMVLEMVMESVFAVADVFFVSKLGADAVATVGLTESVITLIYTVAMGLGIGAAAMVARRVGEKDPDAAGRAAAQALMLGLGLSVVIGIAGFFLAPHILGVMGASPSVIATGSGYTRVMFAGSASILLLFLVNSIFRGAGDAAFAMRVLWLSNAINLVLAPAFIFGWGPFPALGVTGAAVGTTIGRGTGVLFALWQLVSLSGRARVTLASFRPDFGLMRRLVALSTSAAFQVSVGMVSWIALVRITSRFGSEALAGYTIAIRVVMFALLPSWGMSNAAATMVGQALGAGKPDRAERAVWITCGYNMVFLGTVGLVFAIFAPQIVGLFTQEPGVLAFGSDALRTIALGFLLYGAGMVLTQSFNGAGDTRTPTLINIVVFWCLEIPLAWLMAVPLGYGPHGVNVAAFGAFSAIAIVSAILFRRGAWRTRSV